MKPNLVTTETVGHVGLMRFNNPEELNTLHIPMLLAMEDALTALERDRNVRVIVVTGVNDKAFIAGGNIKDLNARRALQHYNEFSETLHRVFRRFEVCNKPTIAAVNGWALGGGMEFMLTIDIRLMASEARIGLPEIKLGIFPGGGGSQRLMRQLPLCQAKLLMFTGDFLNAEEAVAMGLVNQSVPRAQLLDESLKLAHRIAEKSPLALKFLKSSMLHGADMPLTAALAHEAATISLVFDSEDAHEGCSAFVEKRAAVFQGK
ncbi:MULTISPECIES: enoyl-CoA hydratase/isomerase family protein [Polaromonas]|uniref:Enoyl-CoA hydratase/isomerase family protein n=1 Tax=Polaromonas aquatica TaxID=332657 RepID=A0ABW1U289_9BURK